MGSECPGVFYNITEPMLIEEETLGRGIYMWNESAASTFEGFLSEGSTYVIRVAKGTTKQWFTLGKEYRKATTISPSLEKEFTEQEKEHTRKQGKEW